MTYSHMDFKYIDMHSHFFPPQIFRAIWDFFEATDEKGYIQGWPIKYKLTTEKLVKFLESKNVVAYTTYNYAHNIGVANFINEWTKGFVENHEKAIPFGCVWPGDKDRNEYVLKLFDEYNFLGIKIQPLVQNFYPNDKRMHDIYKLIVDKGKWFTLHAGTAPYTNKYLGYDTFIKLIENFPNMNIIVAHMGIYEYKKFFDLLDKYENLYLDTAMVYIPNYIFEKWQRKIELPKPAELLSYQDRILFGSDFPSIPYDYELSTSKLFELELPKSFYKDIFYNNARKLFDIRL